MKRPISEHRASPLWRRLASAGPRQRRWLPMLSLGLVVAGFGLHLRDPEGLSFGLVLLAFVLSTWFVLIGPLRSPTADHPLDEREILLRTRAHLAGATAVGVLAMLGSLLFWVGPAFGLWAPSTPEDWRIVTFALLAVANSVPPLYASWTTRPLDEEPD